MSIVPASEALENLRVNDFVNRIELQLDDIVSTAQLLVMGGPGGARTIKLDFAGNDRLVFDRMVVGDEKAGPNMSSVVVRFTNGAVMVRTCQEPPVWMRTMDGTGLTVESPRSELSMSAQIEDRTCYILVEAA